MVVCVFMISNSWAVRQSAFKSMQSAIPIFPTSCMGLAKVIVSTNFTDIPIDWATFCAYRPILKMCAPVSVSLNSAAVARRCMISLLIYLTFINASASSCFLFFIIVFLFSLLFFFSLSLQFFLLKGKKREKKRTKELAEALMKVKYMSNE